MAGRACEASDIFYFRKASTDSELPQAFVRQAGAGPAGRVTGGAKRYSLGHEFNRRIAAPCGSYVCLFNANWAD